MTVLFADYENGNDNYAGSSFSLLHSGSDGAITSTTFSSASATFPNDGSLINQYVSIYNGTIYAAYKITAWLSATSLTIEALNGGTALANTSARQYYVGGRWRTLTNGATAVRIMPGDTVRMMASPSPTSLGQTAQWTTVSQTDSYRPVSSNVTSASNTTPIVITTPSNHGLSIGDYVQVFGFTVCTNANGLWKVGSASFTSTTFSLVADDDTNSIGNGTEGNNRYWFRANNTFVRLTTPVTKNIALNGNGQGASGSQKQFWTSADGTNVACSTVTTDYKVGGACQGITINSGFTTGRAAYWTLPSSTDFSAYQQVSFWIRQTAGLVGAANSISLKLCSDTIGVTAVDTINIPFLGAGAANATLNTWVCFTVDLGANLGSNIQSIAFYVNTDNGTQTFYLDSIIACKAASANDSLSQNSVLGKNTAGEYWWPIEAIDNNIVLLSGTNVRPSIPSMSTYFRGYYGTTENVTTHKREGINTDINNNATDVQKIQEGGSSTSAMIYFSGGWDRTNMSAQTGETWFNGRNGQSHALLNNSSHFYHISKIHVYRYLYGFYLTLGGYKSVVQDCGTYCNTTHGFYINQPVKITLNSCISIGNTGNTNGHGIAIYSPEAKLNNCVSFSCGFNGFHFNAPSRDTILTNCISANNVAYGFAGFQAISGTTLISCTTDKNPQYGIESGSNGNAGNNYAYNLTVNESNSSEGVLTSTYQKGKFHSHNHNNTGVHIQFTDGGFIRSETTVIHNASGLAWKLQPTSSIRNAEYPLDFKLGKFAVKSGTLVTAKVWLRRDNTGLTMALVCKGGQIGGPTDDVISYMTASANTWEEITISFTPTLATVIELEVWAYGGTAYNGYVDDFSITQL